MNQIPAVIENWLFLVLLGGYDENTYRLSTSTIYDNGIFKAGPELPYAVDNHCMIKWNGTHSLLTGGYNGVEVSKVFKSKQIPRIFFYAP